MNPEPLKGKRLAIPCEDFNRNEVIVMGYHSNDVASAVEWLKEEIKELGKSEVPLFKDEIEKIMILINKAFEDVVKK